MTKREYRDLPETASELAQDIIGGRRLRSMEEVEKAIEKYPIEELYEACHTITRTLHGDGFDTCSIINVKSGKCPEDCKWCAQSAHYNTGCKTYPILSPQECLEQAVHNRSKGIKRYSLVASGRRPSMVDTLRYAAIYREIRKAEPSLHLCASLGLATEDTLKVLREAGVTTYHCNMESAPSHFITLCSTHTQQQKEETIAAARKVGMKVCSGGIIGMGESRRQRIEFALYLQTLGVESIPINMLQPIPGTPLGDTALLSADELLLAVVIFRLVNPTAYLRFSGGRAQMDRETQKKALYIGINSAITGDLLTTTASVTDEDMLLFREMKYDTKAETTWER